MPLIYGTNALSIILYVVYGIYGYTNLYTYQLRVCDHPLTKTRTDKFIYQSVDIFLYDSL